jgi:hypothetical protein
VCVELRRRGDVVGVQFEVHSAGNLICPQCGAKAGKACMIESGGLELIHVERVRTPAAKDVAAKKKLSENSPYAKDRERRLQRVLERLKKQTQQPVKGADPRAD